MLVVGANLTVDRTLTLDRLVPGAVQRPERAVATAGGKAVNVCRAARAHGLRARLVANLPGRTGAAVGELLAGEGHDVRAVTTEGEIRSAIVVVEHDGRVTVLNEPGPALTPGDRSRLLDAVSQEAEALAAAHPGAPVVASGSLPPQATGLYADLTRRVQDAGLRLVLDAARHDLADALPAGPDLVTPNLAEALAVLGGGGAVETVEPEVADPRAAALAAARALRTRGAGAALVTVGRHGVAGADASGAFWLDAPVVTEVGPIGAGDAFAAGLGVALSRGADLREAARVAVVTGSASVATAVAGELDAAVLTALLESVPAATEQR